MKIKTHYLKKLAAWLLPYSCILCGNLSTRYQDLCAGCLDDLPQLFSCCTRCAKILPRNEICSDCALTPPPFDRTFALFLYQSPITSLIMNLKFAEALPNARILGELLSQRIKMEWYRNAKLPEVIIPIPLHSQRLKERGYNQALEIARPIAKKLRIPLDASSCRRIKQTAPQATLEASDRQQNIKNAFQISSLAYQHIAVLDDVITTGNTIQEFCRELKKSTVKQIDIWCCARPSLI